MHEIEYEIKGKNQRTMKHFIKCWTYTVVVVVVLIVVEEDSVVQNYQSMARDRRFDSPLLGSYR